MHGDKEPIPLLYTWTVGFLSVILNLFFRKIETRGSWNIPQHGPVIFVAAPHANQLVDPVLLSRTILYDAHRPVSNLIPNIWRRMKFVGLLASFLGAITLERPSDFEKKGTGTVTMDDPVSKPLLVRGIGTNFVKEAQVGGLVVLPALDQRTAVSTIEAIHGPEEILLKRPFSQPKNAIHQLSVRIGNDGEPDFCKTPGSAYKLAPKLDRTKFFESLSARFDRGKSILIFPEGASHDRPEFIPLNVGVAIMALGELAAKPGSKISLVPCGLNYTHRDKFRSRVLVEYGPPIEVPKKLISLYQSGQRSEAVLALLEEIKQCLISVTLTAASENTLKVVRTMSQLYNDNNRQQDTLAARFQLNRDILKCYLEAKRRDSIILLAKEVLQYRVQLNALQIRDRDIKSKELSLWLTYLTVAYKLSIMLVLSILMLPGLVLFAPVFLAAKNYSEDKARFLASISPFRIAGRDTLATSKMLASLATAPSFYILYTVLLMGGVYRYQQVRQLVGMSFKATALLAVLVLICLTLLTIISLHTGDMVADVWKTLRPLILSLIPSSAIELKRLRAQRQDLTYKVTNFINASEAYNTFEAEATPTSVFADS